eukprot:CAMPEP_0198108474 /NCGR_PEP_ID=MMETSP1442-20131203/510_1 /TAXON_ID= /ORGANISM="Craspedostauros australis, Strain CCMP3328" /LENGTH=345 /DNA_ID=CAMNT_0043763743 /DNA_START=86 /DNA_END=1123 /DNA_ORIENTATION=+
MTMTMMVVAAIIVLACPTSLGFQAPLPVASRTTSPTSAGKSPGLFMAEKKGKDELSSESIARQIKTLKEYKPKTDMTSFLLKQVINTAKDDDNKSTMETTVATAQLLMDPKRQSKLKRELKQTYPFLPDKVIDTALEFTSKTFQDLAPQTMQEFLKPGGYAKYKPKIVAEVVKKIMPSVADLPLLSEAEKKEIVTAIVDIILDSVFADVKNLLDAPEVRLAVLEQEIRDIEEHMEWQRLLQYRVKRHQRAIAVVASALAVSLVAYSQRNAAVVTAIKSGVSMVSAAILSVVNFLLLKIRWALGVLKTGFIVVTGWIGSLLPTSASQGTARKAINQKGKRALKRAR